MKSALKITGYVVGALVLIVVFVIGWASLRWDAKSSRSVQALKAPSDSATLIRGEFLYRNSLTCWECHGDERDPNVPPQGGRKFDLTGLSPALGVFYARNITPDRETGIGDWTDGEVVRTIREGMRRDGTPLFPIMPMDPLHGLTDDDALAITAYLRTLPAVKNAIPEREVTLFSKVLFTLGAVGPRSAITKKIPPAPKEPPALYGRYIAHNASLCYDCHTPRSLKDGSFYSDSLFAGSSIEFGFDGDYVSTAYAPNITPDMATGIGSWTEETFITLLRTGVGPDGVVRNGFMPYAAYSQWPEEDIKALFAYLKTVRPIERTEPPRTWRGDALSHDPEKLGWAMYDTYCVRCHGKNGEGGLSAKGSLPEALKSYDDKGLMESINKGAPDLNMPGFDKTLNEEQMKGLVTYLRGMGK